MKDVPAVLRRRLILTTALLFAIIHPARAQSAYTVTERGPDYAVHQKVTLENGTNRVHRYIELATGLNYTNSAGQLVPSSDAITILPTGGAVANQGRHTVSFPGDIDSGVLEVVTPDGRHLRSRPLGVSYDDGSNTVFIATLKHAIGYLTSSNTVTYRDAFDGLKADLVCRYRRGGFEADLVLRQQPPTPGQYGLDNSFSTLQMVTEFFDTADPEQVPGATDDWFGLQDTTLKFGQLTMTHGKAFAFSGTNSQLSTANSQPATPVYKNWVHTGGRTFLIESVPVLDIADDLNALPLTASLTAPKSSTAPKLANLQPLTFPPSHGIQASTNQLLLATAGVTPEPGVVLDYTTIDSDQTDDYTFAPDTTYLISGPVGFDGNVTLQGGTVIKYGDSSSQITLGGNLTCPDPADRPAVFTSADDDSVGEHIDSDGASGYTALVFPVYGWAPLENLRIFNAGTAISTPGGTYAATDCQFINCYQAFTVSDYNSIDLTLDNCLLSNLGDAVLYEDDVDEGEDNLTLNFCTLDLCNSVIDNNINAGALVNIYAQSCIFANSGNWLEQSDIYSQPYGAGGSSYDNAYYNCGAPLPGDTDSHALTASPFKGAAAATYYLADNTLRDIGGGPYDAVLDIQTRTTFTPQDGGFPDTNTPDLGYHYPVNEDSDYDGLPDWWEWHWFGTYAYSGTNMDSSGSQTLLQDYISYVNGTTVDPNIIQFSIEATNDYVNQTNVNVQLNITGGVPSYYAVLVNGSTTTNWLSSTTTNLPVTLGATDGEYQVEVGLKGFAPEATETWMEYGFVVDRVSPAMTITNPVLSAGVAVVAKPYIQLQGFANETLYTLSYDISNATGLFTNQDMFVTSQVIDTNTFEAVTNDFVAFDVPLATNDNWITVRITDRAGNTTVTNFDVILDYTTATTPPVVSLSWPQDGWSVSGTSCTIRGTLSDETGSVQAQVVNNDGVTITTNAITGTVERNHVFWLDNVPLNGTNWISVQATDAAGNVTTTNFTLYPSAMTLTIDTTPSLDSSFQSSGSVSGTVSDPAAYVVINGINATVATDMNGSGTYDWSADNVPIYGTGTATFDASAADNATDASSPRAAAANAATEVDVPCQSGIARYTWNEHDWTDVYPTGSREYDLTYSKDFTGWFADDPTHPGFPQYQFIGFGSISGLSEGEAVDDSWGWSDQLLSGDDITVPQADIYDSSYPTYPSVTMVSHYYAQNGSKKLYYAWEDALWTEGTGHPFLYYTKTGAATENIMHTGGRSKSQNQNLFCIHVSARAYDKPDTHRFSGGFPTPWAPTISHEIDPTRLIINGRHPGTDGNLWLALPDNEPVDITVNAPGVQHFTAETTVAKYKLQILADSTRGMAFLEPDKIDPYANFCVGDIINFEPYWEPSTPPYITIECSAGISYFHWSLPGNYYNSEMKHYANGSLDPFVNTDALTHETATNNWWVSGSPDDGYTASVGMNLKFPNGQNASIAALGKFTMYRPKFHLTTLTSSVNVLTDVRYGLGLWFHTATANGISFLIHLDENKFTGSYNFMQVCNNTTRQQEDSDGIWHVFSFNISGPYLDADPSGLSDSPGMAFWVGPTTGTQMDAASVGEAFTTWWMFTPDGGHRVPLNSVDWFWRGVATNGPSGWGLNNGTNSVNPNGSDTQNYPMWKDNLTSGNFNPPLPQ